MKFDRTAPGEGVDAKCRLENGKVFLEWEFYFTEDVCEQESIYLVQPDAPDGGREQSGLAVESRQVRKNRPGNTTIVSLLVTDRQGNVALECMQMAGEEEPLKSILLQPCLWCGVRDPYLYTLKAVLADGAGNCLDRICRAFPLRRIEKRRSTEPDMEELFLNGEPFIPKAVRYSLPEAGSEEEIQRLIEEDLRLLLRLGANCICVEEKELSRLFLQLCDRAGFLVYLIEDSKPEKPAPERPEPERPEPERPEPAWLKKTLPVWWGRIEPPVFRGEKESLILTGNRQPASLFYKYKAKWNPEPFVYIVPESVKQLKSGNYMAICYSSCDRVALYSDGYLFEFQRGEGEFIFREIPAKAPCITLTAEGEGCSQALSFHKTFNALLFADFA